MPRQYIRHPAQIPIQVEDASHTLECPAQTHNISLGGLACESRLAFSPGDRVEIVIPILQPAFSAQGHVMWCEKYIDHFLLGIGFENLQQVYAIRMIEQVCHIEQYKQSIEKNGRAITTEEAALEWISKYAKEFPKLH